MILSSRQPIGDSVGSDRDEVHRIVDLEFRMLVEKRHDRLRSNRSTLELQHDPDVFGALVPHIVHQVQPLVS